MLFRSKEYLLEDTTSLIYSPGFNEELAGTLPLCPDELKMGSNTPSTAMRITPANTNIIMIETTVFFMCEHSVTSFARQTNNYSIILPEDSQSGACNNPYTIQSLYF